MITHLKQSAVDPSVPADELRRIADKSIELGVANHSGSTDVQRAATQNPNFVS
jgi:hypothetical protein